MKKFFATIVCLAFALLMNAQIPGLQWAHNVGSTWYDECNSITVDRWDNVITTGIFTNIVDFDPGPATVNLDAALGAAYFQKLDPSGKLMWAKVIGGPSGIDPRSITTDSKGNIIISGNFFGTVDMDPSPTTQYNLTASSQYTTDVFILKLDINGDFVWAVKIGGSNIDYAHQTVTDKEDNIYTVGAFTDLVDFDPGPSSALLSCQGLADIYIQKLNASGNFVWAKKVGGYEFDYGSSIVVNDDFEVYISGYFQLTADFNPDPNVDYLLFAQARTDGFILKLDALGRFLWVKQIGGPVNERIKSITLDKNNNIYTTGGFYNTVDFNPGSGTYNLTATFLDAFILKLAPDGSFIWAKQIGPGRSDSGLSVSVDDNNDVYTAGFFESTADFDPGQGTQNITSNGTWDLYLQKLDSSGNFDWAFNLGGTGSEINIDLFTKSGNIYLAGGYENTADFDPGPGTLNLTSAGSRDCFVMKLGSNPTNIIKEDLGSPFTLYPNPTSGPFTIQFESVLPAVEVSIYNIKGQSVYQAEYQFTDQIKIDLMQPEGVYLAKIKTAKGNKTIKLIKR